MTRRPYLGPTAEALARELGYRTCYRRPLDLHCPESRDCDCLRTELPLEAQAKSTGRLGTPDRNHTCPACHGWGYLYICGGSATCPRCAGCGERKANREPADHAFPGGGK